ncbi:alpha/beta-hydrolase [Ramicandelaber brevisporus]|nr:alpha/beta-hydrolase [Ramicandelaber brevisporus]
MYSQQKLPILVEVYGGPRGQLVTNEFKFPRHIRSIMAVYNAGFAVLCVDGRGSANRGHEFESQITMPYLGVNEAADQTEVDGSVMQFAKSLDFERVAVYGWSYGGYLALKCIAHHPHTFKMAIAGSPVTDWMLYDTAYTERYLGVPSTKDPAVAARYRASSVLVDAPLFPNEPNRVLIVHGDQDENVQIEHSMKLSAELVKLGKPHTLQPFHGERHGFKSHESNIHLDTLMLYWLQNYL